MNTDPPERGACSVADQQVAAAGSDRPRRNLLLFGCDVVPHRKTSELNYWHDMIEVLRRRFEQVVVLSINNRPASVECPYPNVFYYNIAPVYPGRVSRKDADREFSGSKLHGRKLGLIYKTATLLKCLNTFRRLIQQHDVGIVHYVRIFGLLDRVVMRRCHDVLFTITVPTLIDRGFPAHAVYHAVRSRVFGAFDRVIATSRATAARLAESGLSGDRIVTIHWGARFAHVPAARGRDATRRRFGAGRDDLLILWAGPLQAAGRDEFFYALRVAQKCRDLDARCRFVFALKPGKLRADYTEAAGGFGHVRVLETDRDTFGELRDAVDVFLSPICNRNRTAAPPLTWIEMMRSGVPVVTTDVAGVREIVLPDRTGFIADDIESTAKLLAGLDHQRLNEIGAAARDWVATHYNVEAIAGQYVDLWCRLEQSRAISREPQWN